MLGMGQIRSLEVGVGQVPQNISAEGPITVSSPEERPRISKGHELFSYVLHVFAMMLGPNMPD
ncbi:hypothetical protein BKA67DRAFT_564188 [Truncatella angustata]|uniref:Uncharacterized protein n=1 Tax=Truncatella angustata TaxID=152316 RepID=A0A9P8UL47_9PEZI|nr:uncharacterized protein BKA67DRAFT_564188 [Truncatella angustata]KAH6654114.1 hypothetical protein BKA67DRAFT_564188 [Truncatella angustata]